MNDFKYACPHCKMVCHKTTDKFSLEIPLHGGMFKKTNSFAQLMWDTAFEEDESVRGEAVICPHCLQTYGDTVTGIGFASSLILKLNQ